MRLDTDEAYRLGMVSTVFLLNELGRPRRSSSPSASPNGPR